MEMLVPVLLSILCGAGSIGYAWALHAELKASRQALADKVRTFDDVTKKASEANLSIAEKLLQVDERIASLEFKINAQLPNSSPIGWKRPNG